MPEFSKNFIQAGPAPRRERHSMEFLLGQHSLFLAGIGQSFFYLHLFKPFLPVWVAAPFLLTPWAVVYVLFFHDRSLFPPHAIRRCWLFAAGASALFTLVAEMVWIFGYMPPPTADHRVAAEILVQVLMNLGWLSFIPMIRDYRHHSDLWS